ncbi:hypothetical protein [Advenella sp. FME57]|uniref:hypothetical protein n=1 Tax=Advenella sp. FME57 TaxID=2742604 RepID=UPI00351BFD50
MNAYTIEITDLITDEMNKIIGDGLNAFNDAITNIDDRQPLAIVVKDTITGAVQGGMLGRS